MTVAQLDRELGVDEIVYWEAYFAHEPSSHDRSWLQTSVIRAEMCDLMSGEVPSLATLMPDNPWGDHGDS